MYNERFMKGFTNEVPDYYVNLTEICKIYDLTIIQMEEVMIKHGLMKNSLATKKSLHNSMAKEFIFYGNKKRFLWDKRSLRRYLSKNSNMIESVKYWYEIIIDHIDECNELIEDGYDKEGYYMLSSIFDNVPIEILEDIKKMVGNQYEY